MGKGNAQVHACCTRESVSFVAVKFTNEVVHHQWCGPLVLRRATGHRDSHAGGSRSAHDRLRRSPVWRSAGASHWRTEVVVQGGVVERWLGSTAERKRTALRCSLAKNGTSLRLVPCLLRVASSFAAECARCSLRSTHSVLSLAGLAWQTGAHGSQAIRAPSAA